ncbi:protein CrcB [bacterium SCN 62-11]|nr:fluoride efflux transporter CrcB [Candidatus Eremiobacteraeota bacterium]ODT57284.1 MAG: protein CrcB [bacterium SCN 62-11]
MSYWIVFLGAGLGGCLRHFINTLSKSLTLPWATFFINVTGSMVMGMTVAYLAHRGNLSQNWRLFFATGVLGGYTTFSTFSLDAAVLIEKGKPGAACAYIAGSVLLGLLGLFGGMRAVGFLLKTP